MGTLSDWIKWNLPAVPTGQHDGEVESWKAIVVKGQENLIKLQGQLMESESRHAATLLELATLKNKIVERAQVPPILRAKSSADVRRIVEQANEAEFEEQANGIR